MSTAMPLGKTFNVGGCARVVGVLRLRSLIRERIKLRAQDDRGKGRLMARLKACPDTNQRGVLSIPANVSLNFPIIRFPNYQIRSLPAPLSD